MYPCVHACVCMRVCACMCACVRARGPCRSVPVEMMTSLGVNSEPSVLVLRYDMS